MSAANCTHEVADCSPDEVIPPRWCTWEPCTITKDNRDTFDLVIHAGDEVVVCKLVPKRFVRPLAKVVQPTPRKRSYGWSPSELAHLRDAKRARVDALARGERASQPRAWIRKYLQEQGVTKR